MAEQRQWKRVLYPAGRHNEGDPEVSFNIERNDRSGVDNPFGEGGIEISLNDVDGATAIAIITPETALLIIKDMLEIVAQCRDYPAETSED